MSLLKDYINGTLRDYLKYQSLNEVHQNYNEKDGTYTLEIIPNQIGSIKYRRHYQEYNHILDPNDDDNYFFDWTQRTENKNINVIDALQKKEIFNQFVRQLKNIILSKAPNYNKSSLEIIYGDQKPGKGGVSHVLGFGTTTSPPSFIPDKIIIKFNIFDTYFDTLPIELLAIINSNFKTQKDAENFVLVNKQLAEKQYWVQSLLELFPGIQFDRNIQRNLKDWYTLFMDSIKLLYEKPELLEKIGIKIVKGLAIPQIFIPEEQTEEEKYFRDVISKNEISDYLRKLYSQKESRGDSQIIPDRTFPIINRQNYSPPRGMFPTFSF